MNKLVFLRCSFIKNFYKVKLRSKDMDSFEEEKLETEILDDAVIQKPVEDINTLIFNSHSLKPNPFIVKKSAKINRI